MTMTEQMRYTPGPWRFVEKGRGWRDARRTVACVNACEGIPTEALEAGVVRELIDAAESALFALENCGPERLLDDFEVDAIERLQTVLARVRGEA